MIFPEEHRYIEISQKEFYQVYAFFNQVPERGANGFNPRRRIASPLAAARQAELAGELARLRKELSSPEDISEDLERWAREVSAGPGGGWEVLVPAKMAASGGSTLRRLKDNSILAGGADPQKNIYDIASK